MSARILHSQDPAAITQAAEWLRAGQVVGIPTETVYGLAASAFDADAVLKVFACKQRPAFDPLIVHVASSLSHLDALSGAGIVDSAAMTDAARRTASLLMRRFWPGPLTLVLPKGPRIPDLVTSGLAHVGVRCPAHPVTQSLITAAGLPLAAPSANKFGRISPTTAQHVFEELGADISFILDAGPTTAGLESTVLSVAEDGRAFLLRPGAVPVEEIESALGQALLSPAQDESRKSPGHALSHYAPRKPLYCLPAPVAAMSPMQWQALQAIIPSHHTIGLLTISETPSLTWPWPLVAHVVLDAQGHDRQAAQHLFSALRQLDAAAADTLLCEPVLRHDGLWRAIKDRLARACSPLP